MNAHNVNNNLPKPEDAVPDDVRSRQLDNEFADFTDALLAGRDIATKTSDELHDLAVTVRHLKALMVDAEAPNAASRERLARRLDAAWIENQQRRRFSVISALNSRRAKPFVGLAATLVLLIAAAAIFGDQLSNAVSPGFANGPIKIAFVIVAGLFVAALIVVGLRGQK